MEKQKQNNKYLAFPIPEMDHTKFKTLSSMKGKTFKDLFLELAHEYFQRPENQKILAHIGK